MKYYKWTAAGKAIYGAGTYSQTDWQPRINGPLKMCEFGYHVCTAEQVPYWCGTELWEVEVDDVVETANDKTLVRSWKLVRKLKWSRDDMVAYAKACAERAKHTAASDDDFAAAAAATAAAHAAAYAAADAAAYAAARAAAYAAAYAAADAEDAAYAAAYAAADAEDAEDTERKWQREWIETRIGEKL